MSEDQDVLTNSGNSRAIKCLRLRLESYKYESPAPSPLRMPNSKKRHNESGPETVLPAEDDTLPVLSTIQAPPRKKSKKKPSRPYAPPEVYGHLHMLPDYLERELDGEY
jgi:hypothetical protein